MGIFNPIFFLATVVVLTVGIALIAWLSFLFAGFRLNIDIREIDQAAVEIGEIFIESEFTTTKNVFDPVKLNQIEVVPRPGTRLEDFIDRCDIGYDITITSLATETACERKQDCLEFYNRTCGTGADAIEDDDYRCVDPILSGETYCQCKKPESDTWISKHTWSFSTVVPWSPNEESQTIINTAIDSPSRTHPQMEYGTVIPAQMRVATIRNWFTRATCAAEKAFRIKEIQELELHCEQKTPVIPFLNRDIDEEREGRCVFALRNDEENENLVCSGQPVEFDEIFCRYEQNVKISETFKIYEEIENKKAVFYPIKQGMNSFEGVDPDEACNTIQQNKEAVVATQHDVVDIVYICIEDVV